METYLQALGWWNFGGSLFMLGFFHKEFGKKVMNEWTGIFATPFVLDYWGKFWMGWAIGLNIFFGAVNILSVHWCMREMQLLCLLFDLFSYSVFFALVIWGTKTKHLGKGVYSVYLIFGIWISWGAYSLYSTL